MSTAVKTNKASNAMKLPTKTRINLAKRESRKKDMITLGVGIVLIAGLSAAVAIRVWEPMNFPSPRLKKYIHSFTPMDPASTRTRGRENSTGVGWRIFSKLVRASSKPMTTISAATASPERYSYRAWP